MNINKTNAAATVAEIVANVEGGELSEAIEISAEFMHEIWPKLEGDSSALFNPTMGLIRILGVIVRDPYDDGLWEAADRYAKALEKAFNTYLAQTGDHLRAVN
jgi:hypothetical protein